MFDTGIEPTTLVVGGGRLDDWATEAPKSPWLRLYSVLLTIFVIMIQEKKKTRKALESRKVLQGKLDVYEKRYF